MAWNAADWTVFAFAMIGFLWTLHKFTYLLCAFIFEPLVIWFEGRVAKRREARRKADIKTRMAQTDAAKHVRLRNWGE
jgi:hypothetical protein